MQNRRMLRRLRPQRMPAVPSHATPLPRIRVD